MKIEIDWDNPEDTYKFSQIASVDKMQTILFEIKFNLWNRTKHRIRSGEDAANILLEEIDKIFEESGLTELDIQ